MPLDVRPFAWVHPVPVPEHLAPLYRAQPLTVAGCPARFELRDAGYGHWLDDADAKRPPGGLYLHVMVPKLGAAAGAAEEHTFRRPNKELGGETEAGLREAAADFVWYQLDDGPERTTPLNPHSLDDVRLAIASERRAFNAFSHLVANDPGHELYVLGQRTFFSTRLALWRAAEALLAGKVRTPEAWEAVLRGFDNADVRNELGPLLLRTWNWLLEPDRSAGG